LWLKIGFGQEIELRGKNEAGDEMVIIVFKEGKFLRWPDIPKDFGLEVDEQGRIEEIE
jgi:hypothetical protein